MALSRNDLITPANLISLCGIGVTVAGALHLNTPQGLLLAAGGRALDLLDGPVARRTHTSDFGAAVDATSDKLTLLILLIACIYYQSVPVAFLAYVFAHHAAISAISIIATVKKIAITVNRPGKLAMFFQLLAILLFAACAIVSGLAHAVTLAGALMSGLIGIIMGTVALWLYAQVLMQKGTAQS